MNILEQIKKSAGAFLYIFIRPDAGLNRTIMEKRERQVTLLRRIAADADITYWKVERAVRDGLFEKFGKEPDEILESLYANATIGNTNVTPISENNNFWNNLGNFLDGVDNLLNSINRNRPNNNTNQNQNTFPHQNDWNNQQNLMRTALNALPFIAAAGIVGWMVFSSRK